MNWICLANREKFLFDNGCFIQNPSWAPFKLKQPKNSGNPNSKPDKKKYRPSQQTLTATFTGIIAFYKRDAQVKEIRRLTESQWQSVFNMALQMADVDPVHERSRALKTLFLRISELSA